MARTKQFKLTVYASIALVLLVGILYFMAQSSLNDFDKNGLAKRALIQKLYTKRELSNRGRGTFELNYYADISFFIKESDTRDGLLNDLSETNSKKSKSDESLKEFDFSVEVGDYQSAKLELSKEKYTLLRNKKYVNILYLKENPRQVILKEALD